MDKRSLTERDICTKFILKSTGDRCDQALDPILIPHPTSLKIRKLQVALLTIDQKFVQRNRVRLERRAYHRSPKKIKIQRR